MAALEGLTVKLYLSGVQVGFLADVTLNGDRSQTPWRAMSFYDISQVLKGASNLDFSWAVRKTP